MYGTLAISHRALDDLADVAGERTIDDLRRLARPLEGLRVLNLSVNGFGTGTAELLNSSVPLFVDLGLDVQWQVVRSSENDVAVNRAMYYALGGVNTHWTQEMTDAWLRYAAANADLLTDNFDVIVVHDPQPLAIRSFVSDSETKWLMHSHLDLSSAQEDVWMFLREHVQKYDRAIFSAPNFVRGDISIPVDVIEPAIDPKSARNMPLPDDVLRTVLERYGIDPDRPMICQISPCDAASDLVGAVDAWELVRDRRPDIQLVLVLTTEPQDPQSRACYEELARRTQNEAAAFVVSVGIDLGNVELNVFQTTASVVIQKGLRKGFGLWVSDALWKRRPCVVAPAGGLTEQVIDGETGIIANSTDEFAAAIQRLFDDPDLARRLAERGREHVRERFLITRYLKDYLGVLTQIHRGS